VPLLLVALAVLGALWFGQWGGGSTDTRTGDDLAPLRKAAALAPCPAGVGALPALTLPCLGGGPDVRLDGPPSGTPTLVNVYASWCAPCQEEMPLLVAFARKAGARVALLGVDTEESAPRLGLLFAKDMGQHWPAVYDDQGLVLRRYSSGPPVTLFVDGRGRVVHVQRGPFASLAALEAAVAAHLGVRLA
jgi:thiol-disulfide isomerase/thioredoxin